MSTTARIHNFSAGPAVLALPACGSGSGSTARDSGSSGDSRGSGRAAEIKHPSEADGTVRTFDKATDEFMEKGLRQFGSGDAAWPATRAEWLKKGAREQRFLVSAMFTALRAPARTRAGFDTSRRSHIPRANASG